MGPTRSGVEPGSVTTAAAMAALSRVGDGLVSARQGLSGAAQVRWTGGAAQSYGAVLDEAVMTLARLSAGLDDARAAVARHLHAADGARRAAEAAAMACPAVPLPWPEVEPGIMRLPNGVPVLDLPVPWSGASAGGPAAHAPAAGDPR